MVKQLFLRSGIYFSGLVAVKLLSTLVFIFLAKAFQPELFGKISFFLTLLSLTTIVSDWGLVQWFQVKRTDENELALSKQVTQSRVVLVVISTIVFFVYNLVFQVFSSLETILFVMSLFPESILSVCDGYYLVHRKSSFIAFKQLSKYILPILLITLFPDQLTVITVLSAFLLSSLITYGWYVPYSFYPTLKFTFSEIRTILKDSTSYSVLILTSAAYSRGDAIILQTSLGNSALGIYSAGYRYLDAMSLFPSALSQNLFHLSSQSGIINSRRVFFITIIMGLLGCFFGGMLYLLSHFLTVGILGPNYTETRNIVQLFSLVSVVMFLNSPLSTIVQSSSIVKKFLPWGILNTAINLLLNVLLIPIAGGLAAAGVMLITECTGLLINCYFVKQILKKS